MKRLYAHILTTAAVALLLPSCSQDEDAALPQGADEVGQALTISTRATTDESFDSFRLCLSDAATDTKKEEHILTKDADGVWLENGEQPVTALLPAIVNAAVCESSDQIMFENHLEGEETTTVICQIPTDQTDADKSAATGKQMFAISKLDKGETLSLKFQRACSKLVFLVDNSAVINAGGKSALTNIKVGAHPEFVYHYYEDNDANNYYTYNEDATCDVTCYLAEADAEHENKPSITAYLGYRRCNAGDVLMTLSVDGISRNVPIKNALEIIPGNVYTFQLEITPKEVTASVVAGEGNNDIPGWEESNEEKL